jgi:hypothetical protein
MRRTVLLAVLCGIVLATGASLWAQSEASAPAQARRKRVAVFDFDYGTVHSNVAAIFGQDVDVGKGISDLLVKSSSKTVATR